ncbi:MAG: ABC transporter substrate-binding protein [Syntrophales bacterium]|nr:ABC transporter substrate-binding protein [Syntrophales bacterium]
MIRKIAVLNISILLLFSLPVYAYAGAPLDTVQVNVKKVLEVLRDPKLKAESAKETKKEKLRPIYERMFDDVELSKRTLAKNWNSMNAAQRQEFVQLFRQVLEKAYIDKILAYTNEKIVYDRETMSSGNRAEVQTRIVTSSKEIPISYRVILKGSDWKVYDVVIENVSLVLNYRTQFNDILAKNTPEQLLEILRKKVKGQ